MAKQGGLASGEDTLGALVTRARLVLRDYPIIAPLLILAVSVAIFGLVEPNFFSAFNLSLILRQVSIIGLLAAAQSIIVITAGIDLSVAAIMALVFTVVGVLTVGVGIIPEENTISVWLALPIGLLVGIAAGGLNGLLVTRVKLPPFIATLGTWSVFFALVLFVSQSEAIRGEDIEAKANALLFFGNSFEVGGAVISYGIILMFAVFAVLWYVLNKTGFGRHIYAVGDDREAADLSGVRSDRILLLTYILAGAVCAIAAWAAIGRVGAINTNNFYEANLESITAVVIGGISLFGGRGSILGALVGAIIVGVFLSGLRIAGVDVLWQVFAIGWLIIIAVALDQWIRRVSQ